MSLIVLKKVRKSWARWVRGVYAYSTMEVVAALVLACLVGGVVFTLIDKWQRSAAASSAPEPAPRRPEPAGPLFATALSVAPPPGRTVGSMAPLTRIEPRTEPLLGRDEERPEPLRPLWDDPPRDDEDEPPRGLWSGWAR
jgi:hypothetical protein